MNPFWKTQEWQAPFNVWKRHRFSFRWDPDKRKGSKRKTYYAMLAFHPMNTAYFWESHTPKDPECLLAAAKWEVECLKTVEASKPV